MDILLAMSIGPATAGNTRNGQLDWQIAALDDRILDDIGAGQGERWKKVKKQNWLDAVLAAISEPVGGSVRYASL